MNYFLICFSIPMQSLSSLPCRSSDGRSGQCRPLVKCVRFLAEVAELRSSPCLLGTGPDGAQERGVCCPHIVRGTATCELDN